MAHPCFPGRIPALVRALGILGWRHGTNLWHIGTSACTGLHAAAMTARSASGSRRPASPIHRQSIAFTTGLQAKVMKDSVDDLR